MALKAGKWTISDEEFERQFATASQRGAATKAQGAEALVARYDKTTRRVVVELANGVTLMVPARLIEGLQNAKPKQLADIKILGAGSGLYWPQLSVDTGIAGLLAGVFGSQTWMAELGRAGGQTTSAAKRAAARANGKLGGRPPKTAVDRTGEKQRRAA